MRVGRFVGVLKDDLAIDFFAGVPDSYLREFCDSITNMYGVGSRHVIAENEGGAVGLAAGHFLGSSEPALVYLQNSGIGNIINPVCSLLQPYEIPALFLVGWRGEPGVKDEPQHTFQGQITSALLDAVGIESFVLSADTSEDEFKCSVVPRIKAAFLNGKQFALICRKNAFASTSKRVYKNDHPMTRERAIELVTRKFSRDTAVVSTTGKLSRELFEVREKYGESHQSDFLTVGSMGHTSMIATGIALASPERAIAVLDGDGSMLMHMGSLPLIPTLPTKALKYFVFNNGAHESVGGMPTVAEELDFSALARACQFPTFFQAQTESELEHVLASMIESPEGPIFCEIRVNLNSRKDLGRPTETPVQCRDKFMNFLEGEVV